MLNIVKIISDSVENGRRFLKFLRLGKSDVQTSYEAMPAGVDSAPIPNMKALYAKTESNGKTVIIGYINADQIAKTGETRIFATDEEGELQQYIHLKNDGTAEFGGNSDNLVRFKPLEEGYNDTKAALDAIINILSGSPIPEPGNGAPSALQTSLAAALAGKNTGSISDSKIDEFKTFS